MNFPWASKLPMKSWMGPTLPRATGTLRIADVPIPERLVGCKRRSVDYNYVLLDIQI